MKKLKILIAAGPTREYIDPIRYIQNSSSGRTGIEIAKESKKLGHYVKLLYGPGSEKVPEDIDWITYISTNDLLNLVLNEIKYYDVFICASAIADYSPIKVEKKIKSSNRNIHLELKPNKKIINEVKKIARNGTLIVSFKLEVGITESELIDIAKKSLSDIVVANDFCKMDSNFHPAIIISNNKLIRVNNNQELARELLATIEAIKR